MIRRLAGHRVTSLWAKFLILLFAIAAIALSAALVLRQLMNLDFRDYLEGEREDRVYWITSDIERTYEKHGGWDQAALDEDAAWALMLGFRTRITDTSGRVVGDTERALVSLSPAMRRRGFARATARAESRTPEYVSYPLFLAGAQIGQLEVSLLTPRKRTTFVERSNVFLILSMVGVGSIAAVLSAIASRRLTRPLKHLTAAAASITEGNLAARVRVFERDEIGALAETFNRMAQALQGLEDMRKKLLTNVAHELRTPLGAMRGELEGMIDGLIPRGNEQLQSLHEETGRLRRMLEGMEDLAHAQASSMSIRKEPLPLAPLLKNVVERVGKKSRDKGVRLEVECDDGLLVSADPDKLSQVVLNVVDNAVKSVEAGGAVTVRASATGTEVVLAVGDDGVGIAPADLPFIFERFYRRSEGGLGLGLAIVKELMEAHGGSIDVESVQGQGSVFRMHFPS